MDRLILGLVESDFQGKIAIVSKLSTVISNDTPWRGRKNEAHSLAPHIAGLRSCVIGVLDIQGSVEEHIAALKKLGLSPIAVKTKSDLDEVDGLIIPGGESTTIGKLLDLYGLDEEIFKRASQSVKTSDSKPLAIWGTCAGAILIAKKVTNRPPQNLPLVDIEMERNSYGRQLDSFETEISAPEVSPKPIPAVFIRAPQIKRASPKAKVLAQYGGKPVMVRQGVFLATTFHPELTNDLSVLSYFIKITGENASKKEPEGCAKRAH
ncbi:pyridoxal 5'-phosphate synthase glutaminase subunit PdxT [Candidatus Peregrinibacteria bacterium]|nr:pyridoxal 5'-phosphate synthase glutaminase subunit PdxT [Candidatus Peregrinibacteria bacterium]